MPPPRRPAPPANQSSLPPPASTNARRHRPRSNTAKPLPAQPAPQNHQLHHMLPPYQSQLPRFPASENVPPTRTSMQPNTAQTTTPHPTSTQPTPPPHPHPPQAAAPIDHRYTAPTTVDQMALVLTLLEPTIIQFRDLMQGTPFADHVVDADLAASYMDQYDHIVRELGVLWGRMNWDRSALPRLRFMGPISGARWEGR